MRVGPALFTDHAENGGFPEPLEGEPVRVIAARHSSCGEATRVRIPDAVPARAVRRVRCVRCAERFETDGVEELGASAATPPRRPALARIAWPSFDLPRLSLPPFDPSSRSWRLLSIPVAAALVIGGLLAVQGGGDSDPGSPDAAANSSGPALAAPDGKATPPPSGGGGADTPLGKGPAKHTKLVQGSNYHLALPQGWERVKPPAGATFAAVSADGTADVTLWVKEDPKLAFLDLVENSREQLTSLTGRPPKTVEETFGPTPEETIVRLAADVRADAPRYEVLLRAAGPYRYSMSSTVRPDASRETLSGLELLNGSFTPGVGG